MPNVHSVSAGRRKKAQDNIDLCVFSLRFSCFFVAMQMKISATIITFNEESNIKAACESVAWADEIVVVDSNSTDATREIAEACGARVITNAWPGFGAQKQFAVDQAQHEWIFSLDADERVSDELKSSIEILCDET